jgi:hypothetical protein
MKIGSVLGEQASISVISIAEGHTFQSSGYGMVIHGRAHLAGFR